MKLESRTLQGLQWTALVAALVALACVGLAGPANKYEVVGFRVALTALKWGAYIGIGAAALALITAVLRLTQRRGVFWCVLSLALSGVAIYFPIHLLQIAKSVPPIHDISTDTRSPPQFVKLLAARGPNSNPVEYEGEAVSRQQLQAYPDIEPLVLEVPLDQAWPRALNAAKAMGWQVAPAEPGDGQIEATDTTQWFGFKDDIVIRVHPFDPTHTRIDVRSVSRVGKSDLGANAARVRKYLMAVQAQ